MNVTPSANFFLSLQVHFPHVLFNISHWTGKGLKDTQTAGTVYDVKSLASEIWLGRVLTEALYSGVWVSCPQRWDFP